jgi:hypothetical protein
LIFLSSFVGSFLSAGVLWAVDHLLLDIDGVGLAWHGTALGPGIVGLGIPLFMVFLWDFSF